MIPILLNLQNKQVVVVGGGKVATRKVLRLIKETKVTVITKEASATIQKLADDRLINLIIKNYQTGDLNSFDLIFICTSDLEVNQQIIKDALPTQLVNDTTNQNNSDFFSMAEIHQDDLLVAVSTHGLNPSLTKKLRHQLEVFLKEL